MPALPLISLKATTLYPDTSLPIRAMRPKSVRAIEASLREGAWILAVPERNQAEESLRTRKDPRAQDLFQYGVLAKVERARGDAENGYQLVLNGTTRYRIDEIIDKDGYFQASGVPEPDEDSLSREQKRQLLKSLKEEALDLLGYIPGSTQAFARLIEEVDDLAYLGHLIAINIELPLETKLKILETRDLKERTGFLLRQIKTLKEKLDVHVDLNQKMAERMGKAQRELILREQLKTIQDELGDPEGKGKDDYRKKIDSSEMPEDVKKIALDEFKRLESIGNNSPESHVIRNYLDLLCVLPWNKRSPSQGPEGTKNHGPEGLKGIDLDHAREILDHDHAGVEQIKKKIIQHLAVSKLKGSVKGQILLLVGPPGVGKTSLGQSIARAMGKKFMRVSLGGVRDESEIRGHRRTYVGAMPGRVIQALKRAQEKDAVFMLDEIDKMGRGYQGDPSSALLEVLDPEQNGTFTDHYLDVPFDLSEIFFIATANSLESIPLPLLDRMEIVELSGYTMPEKLHIAKNHLLPKALKEVGLTSAQIELADPILLKLISHHTREAGVRDLGRKITALMRASTERILKAGPAELPIKLEIAELEELIGPERFAFEAIERIASPGVVTGLAWTPVGGEILHIESSLMPGHGKLTLTGQLGEVMKESAQIALSLIRANLAPSIAVAEFEKRDIHIHIPSGAIPKDGPSAGVTLLTSLASSFLGRSVDSKLAMTGEITLRGAITPVGGIKEKVLAAHRAGVEKIILSRRNEPDLKKLPEEIRQSLKFVFVDHVDELLKEVFGAEILQTWTHRLAVKPEAGEITAS